MSFKCNKGETPCGFCIPITDPLSNAILHPGLVSRTWFINCQVQCPHPWQFHDYFIWKEQQWPFNGPLIPTTWVWRLLTKWIQYIWNNSFKRWTRGRKRGTSRHCVTISFLPSFLPSWSCSRTQSSTASRHCLAPFFILSSQARMRRHVHTSTQARQQHPESWWNLTLLSPLLFLLI